MGILNLESKPAIDTDKDYVSGSSDDDDYYISPLDRWEDFLDEIESYVHRAEFSEAINRLDRYYKKYDDGFDYWYYEIKVRIYTDWIRYDNMIRKYNRDNAFDRLFDKAQEAIESAKQVAYEQEQYDAIREWEKWLREDIMIRNMQRR